MKMLLIGTGIVCVAVLVIAVATIITPHDPSEEAQSSILNISDEAPLNATEDTPLERYVPRSYDQNMDKNMRKILQKDVLMEEGDSVTLRTDLDGDEDLFLFFNLNNVHDITVRKPDGNVISLYTGFYTFLKPWFIPVDEAGTWSVTVTRMTDEEVYEEMLTYTPEERLRNLKVRPQFCSLMLASRPSAVELDLPKVIDDPYLLSRLVADLPGTVVVYESLGMTTDGELLEILSPSQPLAEGRHILKFQRVTSDGRVSSMWGPGSSHDLIVDTLVPEIMLGDLERETDLPRVQLKLRVSDNVKDVYINGKNWYNNRALWGEKTKVVPLEMGVNQFELRAVSYAGCETVQTVTVTRQVPEYSEEARSLLLGIIDEALIEATEDTPDSLKPVGRELYFRNSISLQTLRDAIKNAEMVRVSKPDFHLPLIYVGEQRIGGITKDSFRNLNPNCFKYPDGTWWDVGVGFYYEYPDGTWWDVMVDNWYGLLLDDYICQIKENGEGFGVGVY